jgi:6-phosphogluconolactonase
MKFIEYADRELLTIGLADVLAGELSTALRHNDQASFCVPGGTTPAPVFEFLSGVSLDWDRVVVFPNDERWVPENSDRSNARMLRASLLQNRAAAARFLPLYDASVDPDASLDAVAATITPHLPISVLLLGMGADMHTASLFPGADNLERALASDAPVLMPMRAPEAGELRVTLTAPVLAQAMTTHILITGTQKRQALEKAQHLTEIEAPVRSVSANATVHWAE